MFEIIYNYVVVFLFVMTTLVTLHELGHYLAARMFGVEVHAFSIGFGPTLFKKTDKLGTEWRISAIPFGGYVQFNGITSDANKAYTPPEDPDELERFRKTIFGTHPLKRIFIYAAGPLANIIITFLIFLGLNQSFGQTAYPLTVKEVVETPFQNGLQKADVLIAINDIRVPKSDAEWAEFYSKVAQQKQLINTQYTILRDKEEVIVTAPPTNLVRVDSVFPRSAAIEAGLMVGDIITAVNGQKISSFSDLSKLVQSSNGSPLDLLIWRSGLDLSISVSPKVRAVDVDDGFQEKWMIGIGGSSLPLPFELETEATSLVNSLSAAVSQLINGIIKSYQHLVSIVTGAISMCNLSGPIGIAETTGDVVQQGSLELISVIAFISLGLAFINLVPIPPLDGFHIIFAATTWMFGYETTNRLSRYFGILGFAMFICVFIIVSWNDIFCW